MAALSDSFHWQQLLLHRHPRLGQRPCSAAQPLPTHNLEDLESPEFNDLNHQFDLESLNSILDLLYSVYLLYRLYFILIPGAFRRKKTSSCVYRFQVL